MTGQEMRARALLKERKLKDLIELFEMTEIINDPQIPTVRGWIMDELEERNPAAFDAWLEGYFDSPRKFFL